MSTSSEVKVNDMTDEYSATDGAEALAPVAAVDAEPLPEGLLDEVAEVDWDDDTVEKMEDLGRTLVRKEAKGRALRSLVQSGLLHVLFSVVVVTYPLVNFGHMTAGSWKALGLLALSTAGHGVAALVMRLLKDPKVL